MLSYLVVKDTNMTLLCQISLLYVFPAHIYTSRTKAILRPIVVVSDHLTKNT